MMKPILFSTPMVQAILNGRKSMTRRVIKDKDIINAWDCESDGTPIAYIDQETGDSYPPTAPAKYQPGDILWVRETWQNICEDCGDCTRKGFIYKADGDKGGACCPYEIKWRPSIFMPKAAARIWLRVNDVRCERVQDMTPYDAWCEGCRIGNSFPWEQHIPELQQQCRDILFHDLWDGLNAKRGYSWASNPWVWVIGFERCDKPQEGEDK